MTIIGYALDVLAADSRAVHNAEDMGDTSILAASTMLKFKLLAYERIAVAVCGPIPTTADWALMEKVLLHYCIYLEQLHPEQSLVEFEKEHQGLRVFKERFLMVMTHERTYVLLREDGKTSSDATGMLQVDNEVRIAYGSGANIAQVAYAAGMNARQAAEFVIEQDHLTGGPVLSVTRAQLKPFVKAEETPAPPAARTARKAKR